VFLLGEEKKNHPASSGRARGSLRLRPIRGPIPPPRLPRPEGCTPLHNLSRKRGGWERRQAGFYLFLYPVAGFRGCSFLWR
jgi:hypothetical protein